MRFYQIRFPLPVSLGDYNVAFQYFNFLRDFEIATKEDAHSIETAQNNPIDESSFETQKTFRFFNLLPSYLKDPLHPSVIPLQEKTFYMFPKCVQQYNIEGVKYAEMEVQSVCLTNQENVDNPFNLSRSILESIEREEIDILSSRKGALLTFQEIEDIKSRFGIHDEKNWKAEIPNYICAYKLIVVEANCEKKEEVEAIALHLAREFLLFSHKKILIDYENWVNLSVKDIREQAQSIESIIQKKNQQRNSARSSYREFSEVIPHLNFKSILEKTGASQLLPSANRNSTRGGNMPKLYNALPTDSPLVMATTKLIEGNKKSGVIYKRGDGPFDFRWNQRYFVIDGNSLIYYQNASDATPRSSAKILGAKVSEVFKMEGRNYVITVELPTGARKFYLSMDSLVEAESWKYALQRASQEEFQLPRISFSDKRSLPAGFDQHPALKDKFPKTPAQSDGLNAAPRQIKQDDQNQQYNTAVKKGAKTNKELDFPLPKALNLIRQKSKLVQTYSVHQLPQELQEIKDELNSIRSIDNFPPTSKWKLNRFKNNLKIYEKQAHDGGGHKSQKKTILLALAAILFLFAFYKFIGFSLYTIGLVAGGAAFFKLLKKRKITFRCGLVEL